MRVELMREGFTPAQRVAVHDILVEFVDRVLDVDELFQAERDGSELVAELTNTSRTNQDFIRLLNEATDRLEEIC